MIKNQVINRAIDYIIANLEKNLTIDDVASHCNFSKYYFSRLFKEETGDSLYAFIKRMKINQSAVRLQIEKEKSVTDVGLDHGYDSTNYSLVFKDYHNVSPLKYRKSTSNVYVPSPFYKDHSTKFKNYEYYNKNISIKHLDNMKVIYQRYIGNYGELKNKWSNFISKYKNFIKEGTRFIERSYDDPSVTDSSNCIYDMCITVEESYLLDNTTIIKGRKFAVYTFKGLVSDIYTDVQGVLHIWLPYSDYEIDEKYMLNIYNIMNMKNMYVEIDICIPIK